jgi:hypothetical protein
MQKFFVRIFIRARITDRHEWDEMMIIEISSAALADQGLKRRPLPDAA